MTTARLTPTTATTAAQADGLGALRDYDRALGPIQRPFPLKYADCVLERRRLSSIPPPHEGLQPLIPLHFTT